LASYFFAQQLLASDLLLAGHFFISSAVIFFEQDSFFGVALAVVLACCAPTLIVNKTIANEINIFFIILRLKGFTILSFFGNFPRVHPKYKKNFFQENLESS
jgi:hypothetical protein